MNILLAAATAGEIAYLKEYLRANWQFDGGTSFSFGSKHVQICITSAGMAATAYTVTKMLSNKKFNIALQAGIGGCYSHDIPLGEILWVTSERIGDMGAEDYDRYIDLFDLGFANKDDFPFEKGILNTPAAAWQDLIQLPRVSGLTVNTVSGSDSTIIRRQQAYSPMVESMEGAAFHYVCLREYQPFAQIRSISNYVEPRDKTKWKIAEAIENLNFWLINFIEQL